MCAKCYTRWRIHGDATVVKPRGYTHQTLEDRRRAQALSQQAIERNREQEGWWYGWLLRQVLRA